MRNAPGMGRFFKAIWGGGERGWHYLSQAVVLVIVGYGVHLLTVLLTFIAGTVAWLAWLEYVVWILEIPVIVLALFSSVMLAYACDALFIRPILDTTAEGGQKFWILVDNVRKRGAVVIPILIALIALFVEVV